MDRNYAANAVDQILPVALRKESVDRNKKLRICVLNRSLSLSARRAWIEIEKRVSSVARLAVALRKESVDRNWKAMLIVPLFLRRSPQGERG